MALADLCVKCGLCLSHCPTYAATQDEAESPRGRIALLQGFATGTLEASPKLRSHIDGCLTCRSCEPVCPAKVPYGELLDDGRALIKPHAPQTFWRLWLRGLTHRPLRQGLQGLLRVMQRLRLLQLAITVLPSSSILFRLLRYVPKLQPVSRWQSEYPAKGACRGTVALFTGCVGEMMQPEVLRDSIRVLTALGYRVRVPKSQTCCGALELHAGDKAAAQQRSRLNHAAFADQSVVGCDSGCLITLKEHSHLPELALTVSDVCAFVDANWPEGLLPRPLPARAAVHIPCTQRNGLRDATSAERLLRRIPALSVVVVNPQGGCCGAAGDYFLSHPEMADQLVQPLVENAQRAEADYCLSTNIGCALHLRAHLPEGAWQHPIRLMAQQLCD